MNAKRHVTNKKIINMILNDVSGSDVQYVDIRFTDQRKESYSMVAGETGETERSDSFGFGVRVLRRGAWGYAASIDVNEREALRVGRLASDLAVASSKVMKQPVKLSPVKSVNTNWETQLINDPFSMGMEEKSALLVSALEIAQNVKGVSQASGYIEFKRRETWFGSSNDSRIHQVITIPGMGISITAGDGRNQRSRSWPSSHGGYTCTGGFERLKSIVTREAIEKVAAEAVALVTAPPCPEGKFTVVIAPDQMGLQIHESIGHPLELDRVFGVEANFSGTSFAQPELLGKLKYGSHLLNVVTDPTEKYALGSYGYDDDGVRARSSQLIKNGVLVGYLSGRETAARLNLQSSANNRALNWSHYPINRMSNTRLEPGKDSWNDLLAGADNGLFLATNRSWSIDDKRESFRFECEIAWEIKKGKLGKMYHSPSYTGRTLEFWRSCDAVGRSELYENWGTPSCGKGEPSQTIHTSQGSPPVRFTNVAVAPAVSKRRHPHG